MWLSCCVVLKYMYHFKPCMACSLCSSKLLILFQDEPLRVSVQVQQTLSRADLKLVNITPTGTVNASIQVRE